MPQCEFGFVDRCRQQIGQRLHGLLLIRRNRPVLQRSAGSSLIVVRPKSPQRRLHRIDRLAGFGGHGPLGDDPQSAGKFHLCRVCTVCTALSRLAISVSSRAATSALDSSALGPVLRQTTPENGTPRS